MSLVDIFEVDNNTFATVLELVQGGDLDAYCKLHEVGRGMCAAAQLRAAQPVGVCRNSRPRLTADAAAWGGWRRTRRASFWPPAGSIGDTF